jgi:hypothetical protein
MKEYPFFIPPGELASRPPREWSAAEASEYLAWLHGMIEIRIAGLLQYFGFQAGEASTTLLRVGTLAADAFRKPQFSLDGKLTDQGYALAADLGLLLAKFLLVAASSIRWEVVRRPKRDANLNQPVLVGFKTGVPLNPIRGSIAEAAGVISGLRKADAWQRAYEFWVQRASAE